MKALWNENSKKISVLNNKIYSLIILKQLVLPTLSFFDGLFSLQHVQTVLKSLVETFPLLKTNLNCDSTVVEVDIVKDLAEEIVKMVTDQCQPYSSFPIHCTIPYLVGYPRRLGFIQR